MVQEMNADETKKWATEREKNLTAEEKAAADQSMKRFEEQEAKRRVVRLVNMVETPDVLLEKICKGLQELCRLPVEDEMLDNALSVQAQRFKGLSEFFDVRQDYKDWPEQRLLSKMMLELSNNIEAYRMEALTTGNKKPLLGFVETALKAKAMVEELWRKEDGGG